jgi:EAL domain-containing protein (putative c-di-GMP-specific phosphodiesterase class I)
MRVLAEGVETRQQLEVLQEHGCSEGQGYYFSRPVSAEDFGQLLERRVAEPAFT